MKDIQFNNGNKCFNSRVCGVCVKDNKILLSKLRTDKYWKFIGGKVEFNEDINHAILREYKEETGASLQIDKLLGFIENFFDTQDSSMHQYIFFYQLKDENNALELFDDEREMDDNKNGIYKWFKLSDINDIPIRPECFKDIFLNKSEGIQHYINREN